MTYRIDLDVCFNCGLCRRVCPTEAVQYYMTGGRTHVVVDDWCIDCDLCAQICPVACIHHHPEIQPAAEQLEAAKTRARGFAKKLRDENRAIDQRIDVFVASDASR